MCPASALHGCWLGQESGQGGPGGGSGHPVLQIAFGPCLGTSCTQNKTCFVVLKQFLGLFLASGLLGGVKSALISKSGVLL